MARSRGLSKTITDNGREIGYIHIFYMLTNDRKMILYVYLQAETKNIIVKLNNFLEVWRGSFRFGGLAASLFEGFTYKIDKSVSDLTGYKIGTVFGIKTVFNDTLYIKPVRRNGDYYETRLWLVLAENVPDLINWNRLDELLRSHLQIEVEFSSDFPTVSKAITEAGKVVGSLVGATVGSAVRTSTEYIFSPTVLLFLLILFGGYLMLKKGG